MMPVSSDRLRAMRPNCTVPKAGYRSAMTDKAGSEDRTFNSLDGADGQMGLSRLRSTAQILVCALVVTCCSIVAGLLNCFFQEAVWSHHRFPRRTRQGLPLISAPSGKARPNVRTLMPTPTASGPHFQENGRAGALLPLPRIEGHGFVPCARRNRRAFGAFLPLPFPGFLGLGQFATLYATA